MNLSALDYDLKPRSLLDGHVTSGRHGNPAPDEPGVEITEIEPREIVRVCPFQGKKQDTNSAVRKVCELTLPAIGKSVEKDGVVVAWAALDAWIVTAPAPGRGALYQTLDQECRGLAAVTDQSHGLTGFSISGPACRDVLAKGCAVDLDSAQFPVAACAATQMEHISVHLRRSGENAFELLVPTSYGLSFWEFLTEMALEFGYQVPDAG